MHRCCHLCCAHTALTRCSVPRHIIWLSMEHPVTTQSQCQGENGNLFPESSTEGISISHKVRVRIGAIAAEEKPRDHITRNWCFRLLATRASAGEQTFHSVFWTTCSDFWGTDAVITWHEAGSCAVFRIVFSQIQHNLRVSVSNYDF